MNIQQLPCIDWFEHRCMVESAKVKLLNIESEWTKAMRDLGFFSDGKFSNAGDVLRGVYFDDTKTIEEKTVILESISADFSGLARLLFGGKSEASPILLPMRLDIELWRAYANDRN